MTSAWARYPLAMAAIMASKPRSASTHTSDATSTDRDSATSPTAISGPRWAAWKCARAALTNGALSSWTPRIRIALRVVGSPGYATSATATSTRAIRAPNARPRVLTLPTISRSRSGERAISRAAIVDMPRSVNSAASETTAIARVIVPKPCTPR